MKLLLSVDERYPFLEIDEDLSGYGSVIDISKKEYEWIAETMKEFERVQQFLREL